MRPQSARKLNETTSLSRWALPCVITFWYVEWRSRQADKLADKQTNRQAIKQTSRPAGRQADKRTNRQNKQTRQTDQLTNKQIDGQKERDRRTVWWNDWEGTFLADWFTFIDLSVKCPRGMKYDEALKDCVACPVGYISEQESSLSCTICPSGTNNTKEGSKKCTGKLNPSSSMVMLRRST